MAEFTTLEIAAMCQRTERSVQRWLKTGRLPAQHIQGNRYEVDENDLAKFLPHQKAEDYVRRLEAVESRVQVLEQQLAAMSSNRPQRSPRATSRPSTASTLPDGLVPLADHFKAHGIPETTVRRAIQSGELPVIRGHWKTSDGRTVSLALDSEGIAEFERRYVRE